jgi:hypothetical protein
MAARGSNLGLEASTDSARGDFGEGSGTEGGPRQRMLGPEATSPSRPVQSLMVAASLPPLVVGPVAPVPLPQLSPQLQGGSFEYGGAHAVPDPVPAAAAASALQYSSQRGGTLAPLSATLPDGTPALAMLPQYPAGMATKTRQAPMHNAQAPQAEEGPVRGS